MSNKKFANEPMLYIQQPSIKIPEAPMQHHYTTPNKRKDAINSEAVTKQTKPAAVPNKRKKYNTFQRELMGKVTEELANVDEIADQEKPNKENEQPTTNRKKQFKEMTLEEKLLYLADSPTYAPKIKCEIKTEDKSYRGIVTDFSDGTVFMQVGKRSAATSILFESITEIRLIGF
ncbi:hypothetical protein CUC15_07670 [Oceanobacillus zhaokaii]|uniref:Spore coat protein CotO n=1 Tax=Oceanobacillus zhaokaii TaxID=2052660 RepID=A0A345PFM2_9BACI|nr:CotO family spore coat protein [Oceanobacillus zhaokaii]AXI08802.1 hypothetical protein CUC15_07670 [Oceanobacillus zhaokaii]